MDGVEGLVHISELAHHHVENPREVVEPGAEVKVKVLEIDSERRRLSLSIKRVAGNEPPPDAGGSTGGSTLGRVPDLGLSDEMFAGPTVTGAEDLRAVMVATSEATPEEGGAEAEADEPEAAAEDAAPVDEAPAEETASAEDAPAEEAPVEDAPADEAPAEDAPVEDAPVEDAPVEDAPVEDAPVEEAPAEDAAPAEEAAADDENVAAADGEEATEAADSDSETKEG
jgi:small subunit ribosomal protein S1